eukprot:3876269-Lingulodinium_polyedra.AAC.1
MDARLPRNGAGSRGRRALLRGGRWFAITRAQESLKIRSMGRAMRRARAQQGTRRASLAPCPQTSPGQGNRSRWEAL